MNNDFSKEKKYRIMLLVLALIVVCVVAIYTAVVQKRYEKKAKIVVAENTTQITQTVNQFVNSSVNSIKLTSYLVTETMNSEVLENSDEVLNPLLEQTPFDFIEYIMKDGTNVTSKGERFDASERVYYQEGIKGNTGIWINYAPKYSMEYLLNFYTPLYYNDEVVGVLTGTLGSESDILPLLLGSFFGEKTIGILCDEDGRVISTTVKLSDETNIADSLAGLGMTKDARKIFSDCIADRKDKTFEFQGDSGKAIACIKIDERTGWAVIQIVPSISFKNVMYQNVMVAYGATGFIIILLLLMLLYLRKDANKTEKALIKEMDDAVSNYQHILVTTATDNYKGIRKVSLEDGHMDYIYFENGKVHQKSIGDFDIWFKSQKNYIHPDDFERLVKIYNLENVRKFEKGVAYKESYRSSRKDAEGYYLNYTTTTSIAESDGKDVAYMTTIDTSNAVNKDLKQTHILQSAASIYISMHLINLKNDSMETVRSSTYITQLAGNQGIGAYGVLKDVMHKLTDEQYYDAMMQFIDFDTLSERMAETNTITMEFLGTHAGWCRARFIAVEYDENKSLEKVLWVVENINAEKREANRLLYLSETDLMTGIRNRGSGEKRIKELIETGHEGLFCLLDIDKFKAINDTFGHSVGDKVIIAMAHTLKEAFDDKDVVLRLGGDEFAVFADGVVDTQAAKDAIGRFFNAVVNLEVPELKGKKVTVSLGAAFKYADDGIEFDELYRNADSCTYESKKILGNAFNIYES